MGSSVLESQMNAIASDPDADHYFPVTDFTALDTIIANLTSSICDDQGKFLNKYINEYKRCLQSKYVHTHAHVTSHVAKSGNNSSCRYFLENCLHV